MEKAKSSLIAKMVRMLTIMRCKPSITDKVILKLTVHNDPITVKCVIQVAFIVVAIQEVCPIINTRIKKVVTVQPIFSRQNVLNVQWLNKHRLLNFGIITALINLWNIPYADAEIKNNARC